ncbi:MAG TPA: signal peptidase I [Acidimicrobiia bacterium]|nr:signal peptidase I [Acidimicrobiia bacterium]
MTSTPEAEVPADDGDVLPSSEVSKSRRRSNGARQAIEWGVLIVGALVIALLIKTFLFQAFYIPSASMEPTLKVHDRVLVNKLSYHLHGVHRGDIIVFKAPPEERTAQIKDLVKRVIGLPGDVIEARDSHIYIDDHLLSEPYLPKGTITDDLPKQTVPANSYFMMGDNRSASSDSRVFGPIKKSAIIGRAFVRMWPLTRLGFL